MSSSNVDIMSKINLEGKVDCNITFFIFDANLNDKENCNNKETSYLTYNGLVSLIYYFALTFKQGDYHNLYHKDNVYVSYENICIEAYNIFSLLYLLFHPKISHLEKIKNYVLEKMKDKKGDPPCNNGMSSEDILSYINYAISFSGYRFDNNDNLIYKIENVDKKKIPNFIKKIYILNLQYEKNWYADKCNITSDKDDFYKTVTEDIL